MWVRDHVVLWALTAGSITAQGEELPKCGTLGPAPLSPKTLPLTSSLTYPAWEGLSTLKAGTPLRHNKQLGPCEQR